MKQRYTKKTWLTLLVLLSLCASAGPASALTTFNLRADKANLVLPDGTVVANGLWGFALGAAPVTLPGPTLTVPAGETLVTINLTNNLDMPVSLVIPGLPMANGGQVTNPGNVLSGSNARPPVAGLFDSTAPNVPIPQNPNFPGANTGTIRQDQTRALSLTSIVAAAHGAPVSYSFNVTNRQGTYLYESGTHQALQVPMGLYGALVIAPPAPAPGSTAMAYTLPLPACAGCSTTTQTPSQVGYNQDQVVIFSEILGRYDWTLTPPRFVTFNEAVAAQVTAGTTPTITNIVDYAPLYYLINGKGYPDTITPPPGTPANTPAGLPGIYAPYGTNGKTLLRLINAGRENRVPTIQGTYLDNLVPPVKRALYPQVIAEDGRLYNYANTEFAPILPAGKSMDVMVDLTTATAPGYYALYDRRLSQNNAGVFPGGMLTFLASWDPATQNCSPFKGDINGDGKIDGRDALLAIQAVVSPASYIPAADVFPLNNGLPCGSGSITIEDALSILQKAIGLNPY